MRNFMWREIKTKTFKTISRELAVNMHMATHQTLEQENGMGVIIKL